MDENISLRVGKDIKEKMRMHRQINWSAIVRRTLTEELEKMRYMDKKRALRAAQDSDKLRKSGVFDGGKTGTQIIREWRDKRR